MALARWNGTVVDAAGNLQAGASIEVRDEANGLLATLFSDREGEDALANPFTTVDGTVFFHVVGGAYRISATLGLLTNVWRYAAVGLAGEGDGDGAEFGAAAFLGVGDADDIRAGSSDVMTAEAAQGAMEPEDLADGATITISHKDGYTRKVTIAGNRAFAAPTDDQPGMPLNLLITQGSGGNHVPTWNAAFKFGDGGAPVLSTTAAKRDLVTFLCVGADDYLFLGIRKGV